jgi:glycine/D-amino acid oxidase-like deaminating enzyme
MAQIFDVIQRSPAQNRIFIVGGGIAGAALAFHLSETHTPHQIILLDRSLKSLVGSTGYAPGFVGQLNESPVLTKLAKDSVREYLTIPGGFDVVGGLEVVSSTTGAERLNRRLRKAHASSLPAELVSPEKAASLAPDFIKAESVKLGIFFSSDGTANPGAITSYYHEKARANGVIFIETGVTGLESGSNGDQINATENVSNTILLCI